MAHFRSQNHLTVIISGVMIFFLEVNLVTPEKTLECKDHSITISDQLVTGMKKCGQSFGISSMADMSPANLPCFAKCFMENGGLIDENGNPHKENILSGFQASGATREAYKTALESCIDNYGQTLIPIDLTCLSYAPLAICTVKSIRKLCHNMQN